MNFHGSRSRTSSIGASSEDSERPCPRLPKADRWGSDRKQNMVLAARPGKLRRGEIAMCGAIRVAAAASAVDRFLTGRCQDDRCLPVITNLFLGDGAHQGRPT